MLREQYDEILLHKQLEVLNIIGPVVSIVNPWYYRRKDEDTWIKIGESNDGHQNFPTRWDTTILENGQYEVMGLMHVFAMRGDEAR